MNLKVVLKSIRIHFFTASFVPFFIAIAIAHEKGADFNLWYLFLAAIGVFFIHAGINVIDDYGDHLSGNDEANINASKFSGGSSTIQSKLITPNQMLIIAIISFLLGALIGLYLNFKLAGNTILFLGLLGIFISIFYSLKPFKFSYRGLSEFLCGIGFGPIILLGTYYVITESITLVSVLASIVPGILLVLLLYVNEYPDYEADKLSNKKTLVVRLGKEKGLITIIFS